jgi:hypothetical protein
MLPQRKYLESDFQLAFHRWASHHVSVSSVFELKISKTDSLPFSRLERHQKAALLSSKHDSLFYKISDADLMARKPFDCFIVRKVPAFVVIMFRCEDWGQKEFFLIDVDTWEKEEEGERRSLTEGRAREIGIREMLA